MSRYTLFLVLVATLASRTPVQAAQVDVPLAFDYEFVRQSLINQIYTTPNGKAVLWDDGTGCGFLKLQEPVVDGSGGRIRILTKGEASIGTVFGSLCLAPIEWRGFIEAFEEPQLSPDERLVQFRVVDSNIYDTDMKKSLLTGRLWDLIKQYVQPRFEAVRIDIDSPVQSVRDLLPLVLGGNTSERVQRILDSIRLTNPVAGSTGVGVTLSFQVESPTPASAPSPEPTLTAEELQRWEDTWQRWDAFVTFVIKRFGLDATAHDIRLAFGDVLIEARFDLLDALAPPDAGAPDPTRLLFLKTWERLVPVVRQAASAQPNAMALQYLSFLAAGDALATLDQMGPDIGVEISADGLRRLARMAAPLSPADPLEYDLAVDPDLRSALGFGPPLPPPDLSSEPGDEAWWRRVLAVRSAFAAEQRPSEKALQRWLADGDNINAYLHAVREVLDATTKKVLASGDLAERYREIFRRVVLAAAWQESCWRQFIRANGKVAYLKSSVGSTGMMQVNEHVWRGLYDLNGLRWDIKYNGHAGGEILMHYLQDYAIARHEDTQSGGIDNLARATYGVYNGGPGQLSRYRDKRTKKSLKRIDDLFWQKYEAVKAGREMDVKRCLVGE